jgi:hypothetical protein
MMVTTGGRGRRSAWSLSSLPAVPSGCPRRPSPSPRPPCGPSPRPGSSRCRGPGWLMVTIMPCLNSSLTTSAALTDMRAARLADGDRLRAPPPRAPPARSGAGSRACPAALLAGFSRSAGASASCAALRWRCHGDLLARWGRLRRSRRTVFCVRCAPERLKVGRDGRCGGGAERRSGASRRGSAPSARGAPAARLAPASSASFLPWLRRR